MTPGEWIALAALSGTFLLNVVLVVSAFIVLRESSKKTAEKLAEHREWTAERFVELRDDLKEAKEKIDRKLEETGDEFRRSIEYFGKIIYNLVTDMEVMKFRVQELEKKTGHTSGAHWPKHQPLPDAPRWLSDLPPPARPPGVGGGQKFPDAESSGRYSAYDPPPRPPPAMPPRPGKK